jgi:hypothetical protein
MLENIYNFNKHRTQIGIIRMAKVITKSKRVLRPKLVQPENIE